MINCLKRQICLNVSKRNGHRQKKNCLCIHVYSCMRMMKQLYQGESVMQYEDAARHDEYYSRTKDSDSLDDLNDPD